MNEENFCLGCGVELQSEDENAIGYTPVSSINKETALCQRCFKLKHYNEIQDVDMSDNDFLDLISSISKTDSLIVHVIDVFDVFGSLIPSLKRITGKNPIVLVGNKLDLLPKSTNQNRLKQWLKEQASEAGLKVDDVHLISSRKGTGIDDLTKKIEEKRSNRDVYIVGTTNVGKSTFINKLINKSTGENNVITTSYFPGTTLGFIEIPLDEETALIDTPGLVNREQFAHYVSKEDLKIITPKNEIKPRVYQLNDSQTLYFGGLCRFDFVKGERQSFVCYFANALPIHRTKLDNADALYEEHIGKLLSPPDEETLKILPEFQTHTFKLGEGRSDIVFAGLGWIAAIEGNITVTVHSPKPVRVSVRKSIIQ